MAHCNLCANNSWHNHGLGQCGLHALSVETTANAHMMECSWENWLEPTSPSNMECSAIWENLQLEETNHSQAKVHDMSYSSACEPPHISPACFISMPDINALFVDSSPLHSKASQHDSYPLDYMNNPVSIEHIHMGIHDNAENSMGISFSPSITYGNAPPPYTADSAASADYCFDDAPHEQNFAVGPLPLPLRLPNQMAREIHATQRNLEARPSSPAAHNVNETRAIRNCDNREATREMVSFLVESSSTAVIEDGYKWCKYGQKRIKHKMHPRCYFKCAQRKCPVKKQTEGSSNVPGFVLITYFGKHNH